eukprot:gene14266-5294_t
MADWADYFSRSRPPSNLEEAKRAIEDFASKHRQLGRNIVLVTSGGTTVPLESNTVRFVDNFSQGTRGASSAEHFEGHNALDMLDVQFDQNGACSLSVDESRAPWLQDILRKYKEVQGSCLLLQIGFLTLSDYLFLLQASAEALSPMGSHAMFYLAAAVSDFYIPDSEVAEHKIQSVDGVLQLTMYPTPKMLSPLVKQWAKAAFVVSFKLETDVNILSRKAREALEKYNHQVVIANILQTRRKTVVIITPYDEYAIWMAENELETGKEIEEKIVEELSRRHLQFIADNPVAASNSDDPSTPNHQVPVNTLPASLQFQNQGSDNAAESQNIQAGGNNQVMNNGVVGSQIVSQSKSLYFQMKFNPDGTTVTQAIPNPPHNLRRSFSSKDDHGLSDEMLDFIKYFKTKRMSLGYTQEDIGRELSEMNGPTYSQSFISRFEGKQLGMKAAERMRPILELFLQQKEAEGSKNMKFGKKRRRRTCFSQEAQEILNNHFSKNPKPSPEEIQLIANELGFELNTVKVWFCNRKQSLKRQGQPVPDNSLRGELEARRKQSQTNEASENQFQNTLSVPSSQVKHMLSPSPPSGGVTNLPFILSQDGMAIVSSPNSLQGAHIIPQFIASSTSQQLVLSQVPFVQTVSAMNQAISGVVTVPAVQPVQVLGTRQVLYHQGTPVSAVAINEDPHRVAPSTATSPRKTDALLAGQFSNTDTRPPSELTVVSPSMISRSMSNEIGSTVTDQPISDELHPQSRDQIRSPPPVVIMGDSMDESRDLTQIKSAETDVSITKKLRTLSHS